MLVAICVGTAMGIRFLPLKLNGDVFRNWFFWSMVALGAS
jgi:hypothetical protein